MVKESHACQRLTSLLLRSADRPRSHLSLEIFPQIFLQYSMQCRNHSTNILLRNLVARKQVYEDLVSLCLSWKGFPPLVYVSEAICNRQVDISIVIGQFVSFRAVLRPAMLCHETFVESMKHSIRHSVDSSINRVTPCYAMP